MLGRMQVVRSHGYRLNTRALLSFPKIEAVVVIARTQREPWRKLMGIGRASAIRNQIVERKG